MKFIIKARKLHGRTVVHGMKISIENAKGTTRRWFDPHGKETGSTFMHHAYGYIRGTLGTDGDHVDVYVGPNPKAEEAYIVTQMKKPDFSEIDEQKVMLGFDSAKEARAAYLKQYDDPRFFGSMKTMPIEEFKKKVFSKENHGEIIKSATCPKCGGGVLAKSNADLICINKHISPADLWKSAKPPGAGWMNIPNGHRGGFRRRKADGWEYWYPEAEAASEASKYTEEDYLKGDFDKNPMHWREERGKKPNLDSHAPVKYAGRPAQLFQIQTASAENQPGYAIAVNVSSGEKMLMRHDRILAVKHDVNRGRVKEESGPSWTPDGGTKGGGFDQEATSTATHAPKYEHSRVDKEKNPGTWAMENGAYAMKEVFQISRTADGKIERAKTKSIAVPNYGKMQLVSEYEGLVTNVAKKLQRSFALKPQWASTEEGNFDETQVELRRAGVEGLLNAIENYRADVPFAQFAERYINDYASVAAAKQRFGGVELPYRLHRNLGKFIAAKHRAQKSAGTERVSIEDVAKHLDLRKKHFVSHLDAEVGNQPLPMNDWNLTIRSKGLTDTRTRPGKIAIAQAYEEFLAGEGSSAEFSDEVATLPALHLGLGLDPEQQMAVRQQAHEAAKKLANFSYEDGRQSYSTNMQEIIEKKFGLTGDSKDEPTINDLANEVPIYYKLASGEKKRLNADSARKLLPKMMEAALDSLRDDTEGRTRSLIEQATATVLPRPAPAASGKTYGEVLQDRVAAVTDAQVGDYRETEKKRLQGLLANARGRLEGGRKEDRTAHLQTQHAAEEALRYIERMPRAEIALRIAKQSAPMTKEMRQMALATVDVDPQNPPSGHRYGPATVTMRDRSGRSRQIRVMGIHRDESRWTKPGQAMRKSETMNRKDLALITNYPQLMKLLMSDDGVDEAPTKARRVLEALVKMV